MLEFILLCYSMLHCLHSSKYPPLPVFPHVHTVCICVHKWTQWYFPGVHSGAQYFPLQAVGTMDTSTFPVSTMDTSTIPCVHFWCSPSMVDTGTDVRHQDFFSVDCGLTVPHHQTLLHPYIKHHG